MIDIITHGLCMAMGATAMLGIVLFFEERREKKDVVKWPVDLPDDDEPCRWTPNGSE